MLLPAVVEYVWPSLQTQFAVFWPWSGSSRGTQNGSVIEDGLALVELSKLPVEVLEGLEKLPELLAELSESLVMLLDRLSLEDATAEPVIGQAARSSRRWMFLVFVGCGSSRAFVLNVQLSGLYPFLNASMPWKKSY